MAEDAEPAKTNANGFVTTNQPASLPEYALRELLAGRLRIVCEAHNILLAAENPAEALLAMLRRSPAEGRSREARAKVIVQILSDVFAADPTGPRDELKREMLQAISMQAALLWRRAKNLPSVKAVQSLACFNSGKITIGAAGELRGPRDSFNCLQHERCAAAAYIYDNKSDLTKMIDALHPTNLGPVAGGKNENAKRRKALKELLANGAESFDKGRCRALGDAYFAAMCPAGAIVATTNVADFTPLCVALGKKVEMP